MPGILDVETVDDNALVPGPLKSPGHLQRSKVINHGADKIQGCINARADTSGCDHPQPTKSHSCAAYNGFTAGVGILERHASLSGCRRATSLTSIRLAADVWALVFAEIESKVVDDVASVLNHIGAFLKVHSRSIAADVLKGGEKVGVGSGRQAREDTLLAKEEGTCADRENGTLAGRVTLLKLREVGDEREGLELFSNDLLGVAADDDEDVKVLKALVSLLVGNLGANDNALVGDDLGLRTDDGDLEGLVVVRVLEIV